VCSGPKHGIGDLECGSECGSQRKESCVDLPKTLPSSPRAEVVSFASLSVPLASMALLRASARAAAAMLDDAWCGQRRGKRQLRSCV
jgi:hypothetical protein